MQKALDRKNVISPFVKGITTGVGISVVGVLLLALLYRFVPMSEMTIKAVNQFIKVISIFFATHIVLRHDSARALIKGACVGCVYTILSYTIFSLLSASFSFGMNFIYDLIFGLLLGAICGIISASLGRK